MDETAAETIRLYVKKLIEQSPPRKSMNDEERAVIERVHQLLTLVAEAAGDLDEKAQWVVLYALDAGSRSGRFLDPQAVGSKDFEILEARALANKEARRRPAQLSSAISEKRIRLTMQHYRGPLTTSATALAMLRKEMAPIWKTHEIPAPGDTTLRGDVAEIRRRREAAKRKKDDQTGAE